MKNVMRHNEEPRQYGYEHSYPRSSYAHYKHNKRTSFF